MLALIGWLGFWDYVNLFGFVAAAVVNFRSARRAFYEIRLRLYLTSFLASMYVIAYSVLIWGGVDVRDWSGAIRSFAIISIGVVWIWPALSARNVTMKADELLRRREGLPDDDSG